MTDVGVRRYRALLGIHGVRAPLVLSTLGSIPIGMYGLAILLLVREMDRSFGEAGLLVGVFSLANAFGAVAQGRFMDRFGQTGVLRVAACAHLPALVALVVAARADAPTWVLAAVSRSAAAVRCRSSRPRCVRSGTCSCRSRSCGRRRTRSWRWCSRSRW